MKTTRQGAFETNSSSSHSITINDKNVLLDSITPDANGVITLYGGEFGWEYAKYTDPITKANYCAIDAQHNEEMINMLREVIMEHTGAKDVVIKFSTDWNSPDHSYIDHQSMGTSNTAFVSKDQLKNFIFNVKSVLYTGNDNDSGPPNFYDEDVDSMTYYVSLEGTSGGKCYIHEKDIDNKEKLTKILCNLYRENVNNEYSSWNQSHNFMTYEERKSHYYHMDYRSGDEGIDFDKKTVRLVRESYLYDGEGNLKERKVDAEKFIKFEVLPR